MLLATRQSILYSLKKMFPPQHRLPRYRVQWVLYLTQKLLLQSDDSSEGALLSGRPCIPKPAPGLTTVALWPIRCTPDNCSSSSLAAFSAARPECLFL